MRGANYMGSKRNAARARIKDHTSRIQKGFFGKQRLDILAKGLTVNNHVQTTNSTGMNIRSNDTAHLKLADSDPRVQFTFAHASKQNDGEGVRGDDNIGYIPAPIHVSPSTPKSRERLKSRRKYNSSSSGGSGRPSSKVLGGIETNEPSQMKGLLDRILAMPDLAGISNKPPSPTKWKRRNSEKETSRKKQRLSSSSPSSSSPSRIHTKQQGAPWPAHTSHSNRIPSPSFSYSSERAEDQDSLRSDSILSFGSPSSHWSSTVERSSQCVPHKPQRGYLTPFSGKFAPVVLSTPKDSTKGIMSSPFASANCSSVSAPRHDQSLNGSHTWMSFPDENDTSNAACDAVSSPNTNSSSSHITTENMAASDPPFGDLFEYPDPWSRIGDILGFGTAAVTAKLDDRTQFPIQNQTNEQAENTSTRLVSMSEKELGARASFPSVDAADAYTDAFGTGGNKSGRWMLEAHEVDSAFQEIEDFSSEADEYHLPDQRRAGFGEDFSDRIEDWEESDHIKQNVVEEYRLEESEKNAEGDGISVALEHSLPISSDRHDGHMLATFSGRPLRSLLVNYASSSVEMKSDDAESRGTGIQSVVTSVPQPERKRALLRSPSSPEQTHVAHLMGMPPPTPRSLFKLPLDNVPLSSRVTKETTITTPTSPSPQSNTDPHFSNRISPKVSPDATVSAAEEAGATSKTLSTEHYQNRYGRRNALSSPYQKGQTWSYEHRRFHSRSPLPSHQNGRAANSGLIGRKAGYMCAAMTLPRSSPPSSMGLDSDGDLNETIDELLAGRDGLEEGTDSLAPLNYPTEPSVDRGGHGSASVEMDCRLQQTLQNVHGSHESSALEVTIEDRKIEGHVDVFSGSPSGPVAHASSAFSQWDLLSDIKSTSPACLVHLQLEADESNGLCGFDAGITTEGLGTLPPNADTSRVEQHQRSELEEGCGTRPGEECGKEEGRGLEVRLREVNGIFEGPCLLSDDSEED